MLRFRTLLVIALCIAAVRLPAQQRLAPITIGVSVDGPTTESVRPQLLAEAVAAVKRNAPAANVVPVTGANLPDVARALGVNYFLRISCLRTSRFAGEKVPSADYIEWRIDAISAPELTLHEGWTPRAEQVPQRAFRDPALDPTFEARGIMTLRTRYFEMLRYWIKQAAEKAVRQLKKHRLDAS
jgi:hypothetical protein